VLSTDRMNVDSMNMLDSDTNWCLPKGIQISSEQSLCFSLGKQLFSKLGLLLEFFIGLRENSEVSEVEETSDDVKSNLREVLHPNLILNILKPVEI
jgi:hypothetical protein